MIAADRCAASRTRPVRTAVVAVVSDLTRFYRALFHGQIFRDPATLRTMTRVEGPGRAEGAGLGIPLDVDGERCFGHRGYWGRRRSTAHGSI